MTLPNITPQNLPLHVGMYAVGDLDSIHKIYEKRAAALAALTRDRGYWGKRHSLLYELENMEWVPKIWIPPIRCFMCGADKMNSRHAVVYGKNNHPSSAQYACESCFDAHYARNCPTPLVKPAPIDLDSYCLVPGYTFYQKKK
jgi:hypothetical protein